MKKILFPFLIIFSIFMSGIPYYVLSQSGVININATVPGYCGNGAIDSGEECDGSNLNGQTCLSRGFSGGFLNCNVNCTFNISQCVLTQPPSGGGGGGGGYTAPQTAVIFNGKAYPKSVVTLLKDAQIAATTIAGANADFSITLGGLSAGNYIFSIYSEDKEGRRSSLLTFPVSVVAGAITDMSGIFIAPTITTDKSEVRRGDNITIFGQSAPKSDIIIAISSEEEFFVKTVSDKDGVYLYHFNTIPLEAGKHFAKSRASIGNLNIISGFSHVVSFMVGAKNIFRVKQIKSKSDLNGDNRVNLIDFSILAYWYKRPSPPASVDLNNDGKINLIDFSIMAYHWTG